MAARFDFSGKTALVTGASKGIGRSVALSLAEAGAQVYAIGRKVDDLKTLAEKNSNIVWRQLDICDDERLRNLVDESPPFDLLVNNAGISKLAPILELDFAEFDQILRTNFRAAVLLCQLVAKRLVEEGRPGSIVNISSIASQTALPKHMSYCTSKAALDMATQMLALELGKHSIRVNSINPTVVLTEMGRMAWSDPVKAEPMLQRTPVGRFADEADVANGVLFLLSDAAQMTSGSRLLVDGGFSCN